MDWCREEPKRQTYNYSLSNNTRRKRDAARAAQNVFQQICSFTIIDDCSAMKESTKKKDTLL